MSRKKKFKRILLCALLISLPFISSLSGNDNAVKKRVYVDTVFVDTPKTLIKDSIKSELIDEVETYIFKNFPRTHKKIPALLVENGLEHNIDIMFMMAQTQQETGFGTMGAGRTSSRRSLFGVAVRRYSNYDHAIEDYCKLLKKSYLIKGRTEQHLMRRYVTTGGARYAGDPNYEATLRRTYSNISKNTRIKELQDKYTKVQIM